MEIAGPGKFRLGVLLATPAALTRLSQKELQTMLRRHACCDWGDVSEPDWRANERALLFGARLVSEYPAYTGERILIITEADRSMSVVEMKKEY